MVEAARPQSEAADRRSFTYSLVVPVYNSVDLVGTTIDRIVEVFEGPT